MSESIRILIADDHTIVRQGLARLLEEQSDLKVVGEATNGQTAVDQALALKPDIIIMDIAMPRMNGIEAAKRIRKQLPKTKQNQTLAGKGTAQLENPGLRTGIDMSFDARTRNTDGRTCQFQCKKTVVHTHSVQFK